jgi:hypothetical protein
MKMDDRKYQDMYDVKPLKTETLPLVPPLPKGATEENAYWRYNQDDNTIEYKFNGYYVDLDECDTLSGLVDWIAHMADKEGAYNDEQFGALVRLMHCRINFYKLANANDENFI